MNPFIHILLFILIAFAGRVSKPFLSPERVEVHSEKGLCYVSLSTAGSMAVLDLEKEQLLEEIRLPFDPVGLALDRKSGLIYVSGGNERGRVLLLDAGTREQLAAVGVGHTPGDLCIAGKKELLFVTNRFTGDISVISLKELKEIRRIPVGREPVAIAVSPDENLVAVAHFLSPEISLIDAGNLELSGSISLPSGSTGLRDLCFSNDGSFLYITHNLSRYYVPATQVYKGWLNNSALTVIDAEENEYITTVLLDDPDKGAAGPCGVAVSEDDGEIYVSLSGTHEICVIDRMEMHEKIRSVSGEQKADIPFSMDFLTGYKTRIPLEGNSPRHLATYKGKVLVPTYFSAGMNLVNTARKNEVTFIPLGEETEPSPERLGEQHFHDASLGYQGWQSCATCHLGNGRVDGLNWDLPGDGFGNPMNTKSLMDSYHTPPVNHTGNIPDLASAVRGGITGSIFVHLPESYAAELEAYLSGLQPVASPCLVDGNLSESALRGKALFEASGCANCHSGTYYTDQKMHDVGTGWERDGETPYDTPTLLEMWRTAPYLHDGRAETLEELLTLHNPDDRHGKTSRLNPGELEDLIEYINSL
jgi:YVTN family beta-propeller protein